MARFEDAIGSVLRHEGGFVDDPIDPGGATHWGISLRFVRAELGDAGDVDGDDDVDADDIRVMTRERAIEYYRDYFWNPSGYDQIADQRVAAKLLDCAVNLGPAMAHKLAQRAINACGGRVAVDGDCGPLTRIALNATAPSRLLCEMAAMQDAFYRQLVTRRPALAKYLAGWRARARWPLSVRESACDRQRNDS